MKPSTNWSAPRFRISEGLWFSIIQHTAKSLKYVYEDRNLKTYSRLHRFQDFIIFWKILILHHHSKFYETRSSTLGSNFNFLLQKSHEKYAYGFRTICLENCGSLFFSIGAKVIQNSLMLKQKKTIFPPCS